MKNLQKTIVVLSLWLTFLCSCVFVNSQLVLAGDDDLENTVFGKDTKSMEEILKTEVKGQVDGISGASSLFLLIMGWVSFFLPYAWLLAFVGIIYAGFLYLTGFANEDSIGKAKNILVWSIIGLILIFMAFAIVSTVVNPTGEGEVVTETT